MPFGSYPLGAVGLARLVGWVIIATTLVRAGWLDVAFLSRHRAGVATAALATLFIVAQIAQNFLSAEYGLLTGGVVGGAFLFAAQPIQRAMERLAEGRTAPTTTTHISTTAASDAKREAYRRALRDRAAATGGSEDPAAPTGALRILTPEEEVDLAHVAHELGLTAPEAVALKREIEREVRAWGSR